MKRLIISIVSLLAFAIVNAAHAAPPGKSHILHCGCVVDEDSGAISMKYVDVNVSSKARGHNNHVAGTIDSCYDPANETYIDYQRTAGDCQIDGTPLVGTGLPGCGDTPPVGEFCGELATQ